MALSFLHAVGGVGWHHPYRPDIGGGARPASLPLVRPGNSLHTVPRRSAVLGAEATVLRLAPPTGPRGGGATRAKRWALPIGCHSRLSPPISLRLLAAQRGGGGLGCGLPWVSGWRAGGSGRRTPGCGRRLRSAQVTVPPGRGAPIQRGTAAGPPLSPFPFRFSPLVAAPEAGRGAREPRCVFCVCVCVYMCVPPRGSAAVSFPAALIVLRGGMRIRCVYSLLPPAGLG